MTKKAYETEKQITQVKKILTELIREHGFFCGDRCEEDYKDIRAKAVYFICLELEDMGLTHTDYVKEVYQEKYKNYKGGWKEKRDSYVLKVIGKKIDDNFRLAIEKTINRLAKKLEIKNKIKYKNSLLSELY